MAQACARLCHQRRHLLNDVGGNGESGESPNTNPIPDPTVTLKIIIRMHNVLSRLLCMVSRN